MFLLLNFPNELKIQNNIIISYILVFRHKKFDLTLTNFIRYLYYYKFYQISIYTIICEVIIRNGTLTLKVRLVNISVILNELYIYIYI